MRYWQKWSHSDATGEPIRGVHSWLVNPGPKHECVQFHQTHLTSNHISVSLQNTEDHLTFLITVPTALFLFLSIFILVCIESVFKRMLRLFSLLIWACLVTMGYLFMFSGGRLSPWDQVDRFLYFLCECSGWSTRVQQMAFKCLQLSNLELRIL